MERFDATLDRIERGLREMLTEIARARLRKQLEFWEALQSGLLQLEDQSERMTLLTRALPCYTGSGTAPYEVDEIIREAVPVEMGFTEEGWF